MSKRLYRILDLPDGGFIQVKFDVEGVVYDRFDRSGEIVEIYGYDLYEEIDNINNKTADDNI